MEQPNDNKENDRESGVDAETEVLDFDHPDFIFQPKEHHEWRQQGPYLVCKSCELEHASYIGMEFLLMGIDDEGKPILKERR